MASPPMPSMCCSTTICRPQRAAPAQCSAKQWSGSLTRLSYWAVASWGSATGMLQLQVWPFGQMLIPFWEWRWRWSGHALAKFQKKLKKSEPRTLPSELGPGAGSIGKNTKKIEKTQKKNSCSILSEMRSLAAGSTAASIATCFHFSMRPDLFLYSALPSSRRSSASFASL